MESFDCLNTRFERTVWESTQRAGIQIVNVRNYYPLVLETSVQDAHAYVLYQTLPSDSSLTMRD